MLARMTLTTRLFAAALACIGAACMETEAVDLGSGGDVPTDPSGATDADARTETHADTGPLPAEDSMATELPAVVPTCPVATITVVEGTEVFAGTQLHLGFAEATDVEASAWLWRIRQPTGSTELMTPSDSQRHVTFTPRLLGRYEIELTLFDAMGAECPSTRLEVRVTTDAVLRVELMWRSDRPPTAPADAHVDLDLHVLHPNAAGYFDDQWDVHWQNASPNWAGAGPEDDPALDRDGMGFTSTEAVDLWQPQDGLRYCVGVNYYYASAGAETPARATVRVWIDGSLVLELEGVELVVGDLWEVTCVAPPEVPAPLFDDGVPRITHDYPVPVGWPR